MTQPISAPIAAPLLGWLMGAVIPMEPDHLCSLIALHAGTRKPWPAFLGGMAWGLGHSFGMIMFCLIFLPLESLLSVQVWEYYGNYVAGALLVAIGLYFLWNELRYLETTEDGVWVPKKDGCNVCYGNAVPRGLHPHHDGCSDIGDCNHNDCDAALDPEAEKAPLLCAQDKIGPAATEEKSAKYSWDDFKGAFVGMLQGLCCPSCIAGLAFVGQYGAQRHSNFDTVYFMVMCFASLIISSGVIATLCVLLTGYCGAYLSTRTIYRSSCIFSVIVGVVWIVLNALGKLQVIEYTSGLEQRLHSMAGGGQATMMMMAMHH